MAKKLKLQDYELGVTLGTGIICLTYLSLNCRLFWKSETWQTQNDWQILGDKDP